MQAPVPGLIVHRGTVTAGELVVGSPVHAEIDIERRRAISRSHTATHLVHRAFRGALGESAAQAGSENAPGRFRFDFTAIGAVPPSVLAGAEEEVNQVLINDLEVRAFHTSIDEARAMGALALFGEKYGSQVRVVEVGDYSRELCGGTHVARSGNLGLVKILGESSIGSGVRRVEALVGIDAFKFLARESVLVSQLTEQLKARREELPERIAGVVTRLRDAERELERLRSAQLLGGAAELAGNAEDVDGAAFVAHRVPDGVAGRRHPQGGARHPRPARRRPAERGRRRSASPTAGRRWWSRSTTRAAPAACARARWSWQRPGRWAAAAAARTTSPRAAALRSVIAPTRRSLRPLAPFGYLLGT